MSFLTQPIKTRSNRHSLFIPTGILSCIRHLAIIVQRCITKLADVRTHMKRLGIAAVALGMTWSLLGCGKATDPWEEEPGSPRVVVTIAPLYSLVRGVAGDRAAIKCLCTSTGPHHYQLDTRDARVLTRADLFLAIGLRLDDSFADGMRSVARRPDLRYIKLGNKLPTKSLLVLKHEHKHGEGEHAHSHGKWDPHVWLGIPEVIAMTEAIQEELAQVDPEHAQQYRENAQQMIERLRKLHQQGKNLLADRKVRRIISFHEALGYFARSFDLEIADVIETGPGDEPSAAHLRSIVHLCRDDSKPIGAIAVEPQYPRSTSAEIVRKELKGKIPLVEIDPLETADLHELKKEGATWFETRMRKNVEALASTLP